MKSSGRSKYPRGALKQSTGREIRSTGRKRILNRNRETIKWKRCTFDGSGEMESKRRMFNRGRETINGKRRMLNESHAMESKV